ncbi:MAG TPA: hypothetical protein VLT47_10985 [Anaeromyxobacteraceae bacterium]|nr:hypothetical protein [Anaeromyxobacteraceae bacterium]
MIRDFEQLGHDDFLREGDIGEMIALGQHSERHLKWIAAYEVEPGIARAAALELARREALDADEPAPIPLHRAMQPGPTLGAA